MTARDLTFISVSIALIAVCSWISVPSAIPFTLQTFAVCLIAALLGLRPGLWAVAGYILLGAVGVPVFSGFRGGPGALLGVTGGYIIGFLFTALTVGFAADRHGRRLPVLLFSMALGILLCYVFGTAWFMLVYAKNTGPVSLGTALAWCVTPYLITDGIKLVLAALLARRLYPVLSKRKGGG
ncbi:MAG: biotin transporter BioY [Clostridia bacterium]|nr:biotin transporter BioY [Clostridia bacterium]